MFGFNFLNVIVPLSRQTMYLVTSSNREPRQTSVSRAWKPADFTPPCSYADQDRPSLDHSVLKKSSAIPHARIYWGNMMKPSIWRNRNLPQLYGDREISSLRETNRTLRNKNLPPLDPCLLFKQYFRETQFSLA